MNTPIPPDFPITKCPAGYARGLEPQRCQSTGSKGDTRARSDPWDKTLADTARRLARAKIAQALIDIGRKSMRMEETQARDKAQNWIFGHDADFVRWCETASMHPDIVRKKAREIIAGGKALKTRAANGQGKRYEYRKNRKQKLREKAESLFV